MATFTKHRGDDFIIQYIIEDAAHLNGFSVRFSVFSDKELPAVIQKQSSTPGDMEIFDNRILIHFPSALTNYAQSVIEAGTYDCELRLTDGQGKTTIAATDTMILADTGDKIS